MSYSSDDFDFSQWNFPVERIWIRAPAGEIIWKTCVFVPFIVFGLCGNFIIIYLIAVNRALRTPTNLIIANMAAADFLTLLICPAMFMLTDFFQNYELGPVGCKTEGFLVVLFLITAVLNLSAVSYDRLTAIVLPTETRLTMRGAKIVIVLTWLAGICFALPLTIYRNYKVRVWKNFTEIYCKENTQILAKYWYVLITIMVWLPLSIMLICYTAIFYKLDRYEKCVLRREHPLTVNYKKSVARTLFIVVLVFIALRLPFTILVVLREQNIASHKSVSASLQLFWSISQYLMFLNAAVNPVIYGFNNDNFRRAFVQTTFWHCCKRKSMQQQQQQSLPKLKKPRKPHTCCYCSFMKKPQPTSSAQCSGLDYITATICINKCSWREQRQKEPKATYKFYINFEDITKNGVDAAGFI